MKLIRQIALIFLVCTGAVYSLENAMPAIGIVSIENTGEESEAKESSEIVAPNKTETRKVISLVETYTDLELVSFTGSASISLVTPLKNSARIILHRALRL
jgi:hypothetical protein